MSWERYMTDAEVLDTIDAIEAGGHPPEGMGPTRHYVVGAFEDRDAYRWEVQICTLAQTRSAIKDRLESCPDLTCDRCTALSEVLAVLEANDDAAERPDTFGPVPSATARCRELEEQLAEVRAERDRLNQSAVEYKKFAEGKLLGEVADRLSTDLRKQGL